MKKQNRFCRKLVLHKYAHSNFFYHNFSCTFFNYGETSTFDPPKYVPNSISYSKSPSQLNIMETLFLYYYKSVFRQTKNTHTHTIVVPIALYAQNLKYNIISLLLAIYNIVFLRISVVVFFVLFLTLVKNPWPRRTTEANNLYWSTLVTTLLEVSRTLSYIYIYIYMFRVPNWQRRFFATIIDSFGFN